MQKTAGCKYHFLHHTGLAFSFFLLYNSDKSVRRLCQSLRNNAGLNRHTCNRRYGADESSCITSTVSDAGAYERGNVL